MAGDTLHWPTPPPPPPPKVPTTTRTKVEDTFLQQEILKLDTRDNIIDVLVYAGWGHG